MLSWDQTILNNCCRKIVNHNAYKIVPATRPAQRRDYPPVCDPKMECVTCYLLASI